MLSWHFLRRGGREVKRNQTSIEFEMHKQKPVDHISGHLFFINPSTLWNRNVSGRMVKQKPWCWMPVYLSDMLAKHSPKLACQLRDHVCIIWGFPIQVQGIIPLSCQNCLHCGVLTCSCIHATNCVCCIIPTLVMWVEVGWKLGFAYFINRQVVIMSTEERASNLFFHFCHWPQPAAVLKYKPWVTMPWSITWHAT